MISKQALLAWVSKLPDHAYIGLNEGTALEVVYGGTDMLDIGANPDERGKALEERIRAIREFTHPLKLLIEHDGLIYSMTSLTFRELLERIKVESKSTGGTSWWREGELEKYGCVVGNLKGSLPDRSVIDWSLSDDFDPTEELETLAGMVSKA